MASFSPSHRSHFNPSISFNSDLKPKESEFYEKERFFKNFLSKTTKTYEHDKQNANEMLILALGELSSAPNLFFKDGATVKEFREALSEYEPLEVLEVDVDEIQDYLTEISSEPHSRLAENTPLSIDNKSRLYAMITPNSIGLKACKQLGLKAESFRSPQPNESHSRSSSRSASTNQERKSSIASSLAKTMSVVMSVTPSISSGIESGLALSSRSGSVTSQALRLRGASASETSSSVTDPMPEELGIKPLTLYKYKTIILNDETRHLTSFTDFFVKTLSQARQKHEVDLEKLSKEVIEKRQASVDETIKTKTNQLFMIWDHINKFVTEQIDKTKADPTLLNAYLLEQTWETLFYKVIFSDIPSSRRLWDKFAILDNEQTYKAVVQNRTLHTESVELVNKIRQTLTRRYIFVIEPKTNVNEILSSTQLRVRIFAGACDKMDKVVLGKNGSAMFKDNDEILSFFPVGYPNKGSSLCVKQPDLGVFTFTRYSIARSGSSGKSRKVLLELSPSPMKHIEELTECPFPGVRAFSPIPRSRLSSPSPIQSPIQRVFQTLPKSELSLSPPSESKSDIQSKVFKPIKEDPDESVFY